MDENVERDTDNSVTQASDSSEQQYSNESLLQTDDNRQVVPKESLLNSPVGNNFDKIHHIIIYELPEKFKTNEMFEFVGFLSVNTESSTNVFDNLENDMENQEQNPPPPLIISRIHCVSWKTILHNNPDVNLDTETVSVLKKELLIILTQLLLGDELAAEYLLYHLISLIYRQTETLVLTKFSIDITNIPPQLLNNYCKELYKFIEMLVPKSRHLPITYI